MGNNYERIKLMELDLDIDLMLKKASESRESVEKLKASVAGMSKVLKSNDKDIKSTVELMKMMEDAGESNSKEYKELESSLKSLKTAQSEYSKKLELNQSELRKEQKEYSGLKRQVDVVNKTFEHSLGYIKETDGSIDQLTQALAQNRKIYRSLPADIRDNSSAGKELKKIIDDQDAAYKELNKSIGVNQVDVGNYRGQLEDLFSSLKAGEPIIPALTTAFKGLYAQFVALSSNPIGAVILSLTAIAGVAKMWFDYNAEMAKSTRLVQQFSGLTGDNLQSLTVKTRELAEVSGESEKSILQAVTATAKAYGLTYDEAFQKVQNGWIRSGEAADDYFDNTAEYVTHFDNAGYAADEYFSILEAGAKNGVYKDKLVDTVKELSLRFNDLPKAAIESMETTFGKTFTDGLIKAYNNGEVNARQALDKMILKGKDLGLSFKDTGAVVASVMGAMGEDAGGYDKVVEAINNGLANTSRELTEVEKAQQLELETTQLLEEKWASLFNQSGGTFEMLKAEGKAWLNGVLISLIDGMISFANGFIETYNQSMLLRVGIHTVIGVVQNLGVIFGSVFKAMWTSLKTTGNLLKSVLTFDVDGIKKALSTGFSETVSIAKNGASKIVDNATKAFRSMSIGSLQAMTFDTASFTKSIKENTDITNSNTQATLKNAKAKDKKNKSNKDAKKAQEELNKVEENQLKTLQEIADAQAKFALQELENDIKNREEKLKLEEKFTQDVYDANIKLYQDKHALKLQEIEEEKRLNLQKIENERLAEEQKINNLKASEAVKSNYLKTINAKAQAEQDLINQAYNQKMLENDNQLNVSRKENDERWNTKIREEKKLQDEVDFQNKLLSIQLQTADEYTKRKEINDAQFQNELDNLNNQLQNKEVTEETYRLRKDALEQSHAEIDKQIQMDLNRAKMNSISDLFGGVSQLLGENTKAGKAAAIAQATINTYQGVTEVWRAKSTLPEPFGTIQKLASTATVLASGLGAVRSIKKTNTKFQDGGLLNGPSHSNGGIPFTINGQSGFEAEGGEFIVNKNSTKKFLPLLQQINGNYKGAKTTPTIFKNGGIIKPQSNPSMNIDYDLLASKIGTYVAEANKYLPSPKVAITEINTAQTNYTKVEQKANF